MSIAEQAPLAVQATLRSAQVYQEAGMGAAINLLAGQVRALRETEDFAEGVQSFIEKRDAVYNGR